MTLPVPRPGFPAPQFEADAVVDGQFKRVSLKDYAGKFTYFQLVDFCFKRLLGSNIYFSFPFVLF
jgi:hypothetical protein